MRVRVTAFGHPLQTAARSTPDVAAFATPDTFRRPGGVTVLAVLQFLSAAMFLLVSVVGIGAALVGGNGEGTLLVGCALLAVAGLQVACGIGLWKLRLYGRTIQLVLSWIGLIGFPIGTIVSIIVLLYLRKPGIKFLFSGHPQPNSQRTNGLRLSPLPKGRWALSWQWCWSFSLASSSRESSPRLPFPGS